METTTAIALVGGLLGIVVSGGSVVTFWMNFSNRITEANARAEAAGKQSSSAIARSITLEKELTDLRVEVARDYVSKGTLDGMEKRVVEAINRLGERVDHAFANKAAH
jgi:hypothetical protein